MSTYPHGFMDGLSVRGVPLNVAHPGQVYFVNNSSNLPKGGISGSDSNPGTYLKPFLSIDGAINRVVTGDIIMVMPGHAETVSGATTIVPDVSGIAIIGLGYGDNRPVLSFSATTSKVILSGSNCTIQNIILKATIDSVVAGLTITGAGNTVDIETRDTSAAIEFVSPIVTSATADNLNIKWKHRGFAAGDAMTRGIDLVGCRDAVIDVDFFGIASVAVVNMRTTACDNVQVKGVFYNESAALTKNVVNSTTSTWSVHGFDAKAGSEFSGSDDAAVSYSQINGITASGSDYDPMLGYRVTKVSNLADGAGTDNLFTVTGRCLITSLTGEVTTVIGGAATMKLTDITNSVDLCAATTIDTDAVGTLYALTSINTNILNGTGATPVVGSIPNITGAVNVGSVRYVGDAQAPLTIAHVLDAADTGAVTWIMYYKPLTATSSIVAAA